MLTLRLKSTPLPPSGSRVEIAVEGEGLPLQTASANVELELTAQDEEDLRWYLEDYLQWPQEPAPKVARRIEGRLAAIGTALFRTLFHANDDTHNLWATIRNRLNETRIEVTAGPGEIVPLPWELLRDPQTDTPLALGAQSFVHTQPTAAQRPHLPADESGPIRILLVICRPGGPEDVPFRSVATRILKGLGREARQAFDLEVLRPASFDALAKRLRRAAEEGQPFHVVHFDGHGAFADLEPLFEAWEKNQDDDELTRMLDAIAGLDRHSFSPAVAYPRTPRKGSHGYLLFENPEHGENRRFVDGQELGELLVETKVPVLVLNACRSARAEAPPSPETLDEAEQASDPHRNAKAWGSLAQEVMDAGVAGVVAMRFNVYVVTAAQFVANLYGALARGRGLGEAVTLGRKQLATEPLRSVAHEPVALQDWVVPVVYEAAPIRLFPELPETTAPAIRIAVGGHADAGGATQAVLDNALPPTPDVGFFGRDETLLALDRAFDNDPIVLLHAFAGSGKTATSAEFARWYAQTGGIEGPVLFTSFEHHLPLARVLDRLGVAFESTLEGQGIHWSAIHDDAKRRTLALQILQQIPVLWIWDNVEPITGFPTGSASVWSAAEQAELVEFLRAAREGKCRFLLTSRRDEQAWLGDLARRIKVPPMPMEERLQLAKALAEKRRRKLGDVEHWQPLLQFAQGNPLTVTVLVGQALR